MTFSTMFCILKEMVTILQNTHFIEMQEIAPFTWVLFFERGKLLVCLKGPHLRFYLTALPYQGHAVPLARHLIGSTLEKIELINQDKILGLTFSSGESLIFELFPGGKLLLTKEYIPPIRRFEHPLEESQTTSKELEAAYLKEMETAFQNAWREKMEKKLRHFQAEIEAGRRWQIVAHEAELLQAYLYKLKKGMDAIELEDWESGGELRRVILDPDLEPHEELTKRFAESRKLKRKLAKSEELLQKHKEEMQHPPPLPLPSKKAAPKPEKTHPYKEFTTKSGLKIYVGKKDKDNDALSFQFASGSDYWFHAANTPGSHVVLKVKKHEEPDAAAIQDALQLALHFSKARGTTDEVTMTQCKYLSKPKRAKPGLVHLSKHKNICVKPDYSRLKEFGLT